ncbi:unnamed protein product [Durusdinium trenchii]|uniref:Uncharacterized protein n=1 Tax=Durusdinium trenchii TaxID=1381693 RepID=A0ABP0S040_9DINO
MGLVEAEELRRLAAGPPVWQVASNCRVRSLNEVNPQLWLDRYNRTTAEQEFHSDTYREISSGDIISKRVGWFKGDAETSDIDHEVAVLTGSPPVEPAAGDRRGPMGPSKLSWDEGVGRAMDMDEPPAGEDVKERLAELGARVGVGGTARDDKPKRGKTKVDEAPPTGEKPKEKAKKKTGKKKKAQDPHWFGRPVSESDEVVGSDEAGSEEQNDLADEGRTTGRKRKPTRKRGSRKLGKRMKGEDRGPFGVGHKVEFKDSDRSDDDDSGSSFHAGPSTKSRQLQLQEYSEQYPGRLAARLLQKMEEILARQEGPLSSKAERNLTPATATSYFLTVLLPQYKDRINLRTSREIRTLSKVLDLMAVGNVKTAGDVVAQRIKSLELFLADQVWGRAQHLELIPPEGVNLVGKDETLMATKEQEWTAMVKELFKQKANVLWLKAVICVINFQYCVGWSNPVCVPIDDDLTDVQKKHKPLPEEKKFTIVYLDNYDEIQVIKRLDMDMSKEGHEISEDHQKFIDACDSAHLPRNIGKQLIHAFAGGLQGGELDGSRGVLKLQAEKLRAYIEVSLCLLTKKRWSEFQLRHWTGKTAFLATFKRSLFSGMANIFTAIEKARVTPVGASYEVIDEIMVMMIESPLSQVELRAKISPEISCTDASPTGGGSAVATEFKPMPDVHGPPVSDTTRCNACHHDLRSGNGRVTYPCPVRCGASLCSVKCVISHRPSGCARDMFPVPLFGERFSGPNFPLTKAVALAGVGVQPPLDVLVKDDAWDYTTEAGKERLDEYEADPGLMASHWAPKCKTFSAARGRPVYTTSGRWLQGLKALRTRDKPWGMDHLNPAEQILVRRGNAMAKRSLKGLQDAYERKRFGCLEHPWGSHLWATPEATEFASRQGMFHTYFSACCFGGSRTKWTSLLHNVPELHAALHTPVCPGHQGLLPYEVHDEDGVLRFDTAAEAEYAWTLCKVYAEALRAALAKRVSVPFGIQAWDAKAAILAALKRSTRGMQSDGAAENVCHEVLNILKTMNVGREQKHLRWLLRNICIRGTEVRFESAKEDGSGSLLVPYPAYRWQWKTKLSYPWQHTQHINVLEVSAFLVEFRRRVRDVSQLGARFFNVTDSQVTFFCLSKGRSSSVRLNRLLRRVNALILMSRAMPLHLWTISKWNFADAPSRRFEQ